MRNMRRSREFLLGWKHWKLVIGYACMHIGPRHSSTSLTWPWTPSKSTGFTQQILVWLQIFWAISSGISPCSRSVVACATARISNDAKSSSTQTSKGIMLESASKIGSLVSGQQCWKRMVGAAPSQRWENPRLNWSNPRIDCKVSRWRRAPRASHGAHRTTSGNNVCMLVAHELVPSRFRKRKHSVYERHGVAWTLPCRDRTIIRLGDWNPSLICSWSSLVKARIRRWRGVTAMSHGVGKLLSWHAAVVVPSRS